MKTKLVCRAFIPVTLFLLCGCAAQFAELGKRNEALDQKLSPEWLQAHVVIGQTTKQEVAGWFGPPIRKTSSVSSLPGSEMMPDEIWTYAVRFSKTERAGWDFKTAAWTRALVFSFKKGVVSIYNTSESGG